MHRFLLFSFIIDYFDKCRVVDTRFCCSCCCCYSSIYFTCPFVFVFFFASFYRLFNRMPQELWGFFAPATQITQLKKAAQSTKTTNDLSRFFFLLLLLFFIKYFCCLVFVVVIFLRTNTGVSKQIGVIYIGGAKLDEKANNNNKMTDFMFFFQDDSIHCDRSLIIRGNNTMNISNCNNNKCAEDEKKKVRK